ncbi:MAG: hypothetical protein F6J93_05305 [Oscillatoria sp. SIO1A7]|nr:hypothetical protein [Oscillatoria sp. SIO1A7]
MTYTANSPSLKRPSLGLKGAIAFLGQQLQQHLASQLPENIPILVRCGLKDGHLMVLAEHISSVRPDLDNTFRTLQQAVLNFAPELSGELRLYLRVAGEKHPYAYRAFKMPRPLGAMAIPSLKLPIFIENTIGNQIEPREQEGSSFDVKSMKTGATTGTNSATSPVAEKPQEPNKESLNAELPSEAGSPRRSQEGEEDAAPAAKKSSPTGRKIRKIKRKRNNSSIWPIAYGVVPTLVGAAAFTWTLTRPCVIGQCPELAKAQDLEEAARENLASAKYLQNLTNSKEQLDRASEILKGIPPWSRVALRAEGKRQGYQTEADRVGRAIRAMEIGGEAAEKGKNPPHQIMVWQKAQSQWIEAIAILQKIPANAKVYPFVQQKIEEYQRNLEIINRRIEAEQAATKGLEKAKSVAKAAQTRQSVAIGTSGWQDVSKLWEEATNILSQIPQGTTTYLEARGLLKEYGDRLEATRERQTQEQISAEAYQEARIWAEKAGKLDRNRQWAQAKNYWREALNYSQSVVADTFYYNKAREDIETYVAAIKYDEEQIKNASLLKNTRKEIKKICAGTPVVCEYTIAEDAISVWLSSAYVRQIRRTAIVADRSGDRKTLANVDRHIQKLRSRLEKISNNSGIPLLLYDPYGAPIGRHSPS